MLIRVSKPRVENDIFKAMDNGKIVSLVLVALSAGFDTVDHTTLLARLRALGFATFEPYLMLPYH